MANDIAPELYEKIQKDIVEELEKSDKVRELYKAVASDKADYETANLFSEEIGSIYSRALKNNINSGVLPDGKMYYNIAERTIRPAMEDCYGKISDVTFQVQSDLNKSAGIGIKAIKPKLNDERVEGIINRSCVAEQFDDVSWIFNEPIVNFAQSIVDDSVKVNADFHEKAGLSPTITRKVSGKCCKWCESLAGTYDYRDAPADIYRRHESCRCQVLYNPGDSKKYQNVHTKKWVSPDEDERIAFRKNIGFTEKNCLSFKSGEDANEFFYYDSEGRGILNKKKSKYSRWLDNLSTDEREAISWYAADGYGDINDYWRKRNGWEYISSNVVKASEKIDSAISKFELKENIKVYRGVGQIFEDSIIEKGKWSDIHEIVGKTYHDSGYGSTTVLSGNSVAKSKPVLFEIDIPAGKGRGAYINKLAGQNEDIEYEFLIARNSDFKITDVVINKEPIPSQTIIKMRMITDE